MKNKLIKTLIFIIIIILLFGTMNVFALNPDDYNPNNSELTTKHSENSSKLLLRVKRAYAVINVIGVICSVIVIAIAGLKYMIGSIDERAEYKKVMLPYLLGAVLVFSGTLIPTILYKMFHM